MGSRTPDLYNAIVALYQLSYDPGNRAARGVTLARAGNLIPGRLTGKWKITAVEHLEKSDQTRRAIRLHPFAAAGGGCYRLP